MGVRYLGVHWGTKPIGLVRTAAKGGMVSPFTFTIPSPPDAFIPQTSRFLSLWAPGHF